jgi:hypothetical protein
VSTVRRGDTAEGGKARKHRARRGWRKGRLGGMG